MNNLKVHISNDYASMSKQAGIKLVSLLESFDKSLICPAAGNSPVGLYKYLVDLYQQKSLKTVDWNIVGLDEWVGMNGMDAGSCRHFLNQSFFRPLGIHEHSISFFDGRAVDIEKECLKAGAFIKQRGGIDVMILGLGLNGHVGFNEPGTPVDSGPHVINLTPTSVEAGKKYFENRDAPPKGITLGLADIMDSRHVILVVSGSSKAAIIKKLLEEDATPELPASILRSHPSCSLFLDKEAAGSLK